MCVRLSVVINKQVNVKWTVILPLMEEKYSHVYLTLLSVFLVISLIILLSAFIIHIINRGTLPPPPPHRIVSPLQSRTLGGCVCHNKLEEATVMSVYVFVFISK